VVPDESLPDEEPLDLDATLDLDAELYVASAPAPTPPAVEVEEEEEVTPEIFVAVEEMPTIIGGVQRLYDVIKYPDMARQASLEGMVVVQFIVTPEGLPTNPSILRSAGAVLDEAAIDAIMQLTFTPGRQRQRPVSVRFSIPVRFRLDR
jgi:protein TonB